MANSAHQFAVLAAEKRKDDPDALVDALYELRIAQEDCALLIELLKERDRYADHRYADSGVWMEAQRVIGCHAVRAKDMP